MITDVIKKLLSDFSLQERCFFLCQFKSVLFYEIQSQTSQKQIESAFTASSFLTSTSGFGKFFSQSNTQSCLALTLAVCCTVFLFH